MSDAIERAAAMTSAAVHAVEPFKEHERPDTAPTLKED